MSADPMQEALSSLNRELDLCRQREGLVVAAMLTGEGGTLLGKPVRISLEWPEGLPYGMTADELRRYGERMRAACSGEGGQE